MAVDGSGNESVIAASTPTFLKTDPVINYDSFVVSQKAPNTVIPAFATIVKIECNLTPILARSNLVRFTPTSSGNILSLFDNNNESYISYTGNVYNIGNEKFYFAAPENVSLFIIEFYRPVFRLGFQIFKNGVLVYTYASVATTSREPVSFRVAYNV
jgi:hypothetical protein